MLPTFILKKKSIQGQKQRFRLYVIKVHVSLFPIKKEMMKESGPD